MSPDHLRIWRNGRQRSVKQFIKIVGDKPAAELTYNDAIEYCEWWRGRVVEDGMVAKSTNKNIGKLSRMLKAMSVRRRLDLSEIFKGLRLRGETQKFVPSLKPEFIRIRLLGDGLNGLNEDARIALHVMIETGMRPSEIVNLTREMIFLGAPIPFVQIVADGRRLKTEDSEREIPLVGAALILLHYAMPIPLHALRFFFRLKSAKTKSLAWNRISGIMFLPIV